LLSEADGGGSGFSTPLSGRGSPVHFDGSRSGTGHLSPSPAYISLRGSIGTVHSGATSPVSSVGDAQFYFPPVPGSQTGGPGINLTIKELQRKFSSDYFSFYTIQLRVLPVWDRPIHHSAKKATTQPEKV
jgi:hypothetical protein